MVSESGLDSLWNSALLPLSLSTGRFVLRRENLRVQVINKMVRWSHCGMGGGGGVVGVTLGISGWGCAAGTLELLTPRLELVQLNFATLY